MGGSISVVDNSSYKLGGVHIKVLGGASAMAARLTGKTTKVRVSLHGILTSDESLKVPARVVRLLKTYVASAAFVKDLRTTILLKEGDDGHRIATEFSINVCTEVKTSSLTWKVPNNAQVTNSMNANVSGTEVDVNIGFDLEFMHPDLPQAHVTEACAIVAGCMAWHIMHGTIPVNDKGFGKFMFQVIQVSFMPMPSRKKRPEPSKTAS